MWKLIFKIVVGLYLAVATYFAWQYVTNREELAMCLEYPKEQFIEFLEDQKAAIQSGEEPAATDGAKTENEGSEGAEPSFWEKTRAGFFDLIERLGESIKKAEKVASESAAIIEEGKEVADKSQDLYDRTQDLLAEVNGGTSGGGNSGENLGGTPLPECVVVK